MAEAARGQMITGDAYPDLSDWPDLPCHHAAEAAILGHVLLDNKVYADAKGLVADDFSLSTHKLLWTRMGEMIAAGRQVDLVTLSNYLAGKTRSGGLDEDKQPIVFREIDDVTVAYIAGLSDGIVRLSAIEEYVAIVKEKAALRKVLQVCEDGAARARAQGETSAEIVASMAQGLKGLGRKR